MQSRLEHKRARIKVKNLLEPLNQLTQSTIISLIIEKSILERQLYNHTSQPNLPLSMSW